MTLDNLNKSGNEFVVNFSVHISGKQAWYNLSMFFIESSIGHVKLVHKLCTLVQ